MVFHIDILSRARRFLLLVCVLCLGKKVFMAQRIGRQIHIMILYSTQGNFGNVSDVKTIGPIWEEQVNMKFETNPSWPFHLTLEYWDVKSDCLIIKNDMVTRLGDHTKLNISVVIAEGDSCFPGSMAARVAAEYGIPIIFTSLNPDLGSNDYKLPADQNTSFLLLGPVVQIFRQLVNTYELAKVKTVAAVANLRYGLYNTHSCFNAAGNAFK
jgi:hypothetical protein